MADDLLEREQTMQRDVLLMATAATSLLNGQSWSPLFDPVFFLMRPFVAQIVTSPLILFYLSSVFVSLMTLLIAGIPAALYERYRGETQSSPMSIGIWFVTTALLSYPSISSFFSDL